LREEAKFVELRRIQFRSGSRLTIWRIPTNFASSLRCRIAAEVASGRSRSIHATTPATNSVCLEIGRASCRERVEREVLAKAEDGIRDATVTGVQTCALPIFSGRRRSLLNFAESNFDPVPD